MVAELDARLHGRSDVAVVSWPDRDDDFNETVELIARDSGGQVVVEHTRIESYVGQIDDHIAIYDYFPRGGPDLPDEGDLGGHLGLVVPAGDFSRSIPRGKRRHAGQQITIWVRTNAPRLLRTKTPTDLVGSHPDIPFDWQLFQLLPANIDLVGPIADVVRVMFARPNNLKTLRSERIEVALLRKLPKLLSAAGAGRRSILVLEDRDSSMSSPMDLSRATQGSSSLHELPDVIYVLDTRHGNPIARVLYGDGLWAHEHPSFRWERFDEHHNGLFNALPYNWR